MRYSPSGVGPDEGVITVVEGRPRPRRELGASVNGQGGLSRMGIFVWGHVTSAFVIPARNRRELRALQRAAHEVVASAEAREWALARVHVVLLADVEDPRSAHSRGDSPDHLGARTDVKRPPDTLARVRADGSRWPRGARIVCLDLDGAELATLAANSYFDTEPLPPFAPKPPRRLFGPDFWGEHAGDSLDASPFIEVRSKPSRRTGRST